MAKRTAAAAGRRRKPNTKLARDRSGDDSVFKALANGDRRNILDLVRDGPLTTGALCDALNHLDRCTVMLHLRVLEQADLIISKKRGRQRWNYLNVEPVVRIYRRWIKEYAEPAAHMLEQLKRQLESKA